MSHDEDNYASTGGAAPLRGYLYQVMVSVWVALDVLLRSRTGTVVELEPASQEDIEAEVEDEPPAVTTCAGVGTYQLIVQVKLKSGDPWTVRSLERMLSKDGTKRVNGAERLKTRTARFLLVTNAPLSGPATKLGVRSVGQWPKGDLLPVVLAGHDDAEVSKRIAVLANFDEERVCEKVEKLLTTLARVPQSNLERCMKDLYDGALARMSGTSPRQWRRDELEDAVRLHGGFLAPSAELSTYVQPKNWDEAVAALHGRGAVVLKGTSGTGKTLTAEALIADAREKNPGLNWRVVTGPSDVKNYVGLGAVLFYLDDPWGRYRFEPGAEYWNEQLPGFLRGARADRMFVVTTRSDVLVDARAATVVQPWAIGIEASSYGPAEFRKLYGNRVRVLAQPLRELATDHRPTVLNELSTPFELQRFFDALREIPEDEYSKLGYSHVVAAISAAHTDSIEKTLQLQVEARGGEVWATVLWGLLQAHSGITYSALRDVHDALAGVDDKLYESGFEELVDFLVAGRSLRQREQLLTYYHPRVAAGLEGLLKRNRVRTKRTLEDLMKALLAFDKDASSQDWGSEGVARLLASLKKSGAIPFKTPDAIQATVDKWLAGQLADFDRNFEKTLELAAQAGGQDSVPAELARYVTRLAVKNPFEMNPAPFVPTHEWIARMRSHPDCGLVIRRFVSEVLGTEPADFHIGFAGHLAELAGDLTHEFVAAALHVVESGTFSTPAEVVYTPALADLEAARSVTLRALELAKTYQRDDGDEDALAIVNGHYSDSYVETYASSDAESWEPIASWLERYVAEFRRRQGWMALDKDELAEQLLPWWLLAVSAKDDPGGMCDVELARLLALAFGTRHEEDLWTAASSAWNESLRLALENRLVAGSPRVKVLNAAVECMLGVSESSLVRVTDRLVDANDAVRLFELFSEVSAATFDGTLVPNSVDASYYAETHLAKRRAQRRAAGNALAGLPVSLRRIVGLVLAPPETSRTLDESELNLLCSIRCNGDAAGIARLELLAANGRLTRMQVSDFLLRVSEGGHAERAVELAAESGLTDLVQDALKHRFAKARAAALSVLSRSTANVLPSVVLEMWRDESRFVKEALLRALERKHFDEHVATLVHLCRDSFMDGDDFQQDGYCYTFARRAARMLRAEASVALTKELEVTLLDAGLTTDDRTLQAETLAAIAVHGSRASRARLLTLCERAGAVHPRISAAEGLAAAAAVHRLELDLVSRIDERHAERLHPSIAFPLVLAAGYSGTDEAIEALAFKLSQNIDRKVMLGGLIAACERPHVVDVMLRLLPEEHVLRQIRLQAAASIPRSSLADLGDVETVRVAEKWLSQWLEPKPVFR